MPPKLRRSSRNGNGNGAADATSSAGVQGSRSGYRKGDTPYLHHPYVPWSQHAALDPGGGQEEEKRRPPEVWGRGSGTKLREEQESAKDYGDDLAFTRRLRETSARAHGDRNLQQQMKVSRKSDAVRVPDTIRGHSPYGAKASSMSTPTSTLQPLDSSPTSRTSSSRVSIPTAHTSTQPSRDMQHRIGELEDHVYAIQNDMDNIFFHTLVQDGIVFVGAVGLLVGAMWTIFREGSLQELMGWFCNTKDGATKK